MLTSTQKLYANEYTLHDTFVDRINQTALSVFETHQGSQQTLSG